MTLNAFLHRSALAVAVCLAGCSPTDSGPGSGGGSGGSGSGGSGGRGGSGGSSSSGGSGGSTGGSTAGSGGSSAGGTGGSSGGESGGSGGATGGSGGAGGSGGSGGAGGSGGTGGAGGSGGSGGTPDGGGAEAPAGGGVELLGKVHKTLFKVTIANYDPDGRSGCVPNAAMDNPIRNQRSEDTFKGDATKTYDVTFRVRGLAEPKGYAGGMTDPASPFIYIGGMPTTNGAENLGGQYLRLRIEVSEPRQVYYLNRFVQGEHRDHEVYPMDYRLKVKVKGGATVAAILQNGNNCAIANYRNRMVDGLPADVITQPFKDQFLYIEGDTVVAAP